jgi:hypothetical protein
MSSTTGNHEHSNSTRRPFQFGLRALLLAMACLSVLFSVMSLVGPMWSTILVWFLVLVAAHVVGNSWGSRRWPADRTLPAEADELAGAQSLRFASGSCPNVPATQLCEATKLGWMMPLAAGSGAVLGGAIGVGFLLWLGFEQVGYAGITVGGCSAAVVGGLAGFLASSFVSVARGAWQEAVETGPATTRGPQN